MRRSGRAAEIGAAGVMQRVGAAGGPGPIGFQGPPRSLKISPVNIQDEPADPTQSEYSSFYSFSRFRRGFKVRTSLSGEEEVKLHFL